MEWLDDFIVQNRDAINFFGIFWVVIFFSIGIALLVFALVFRNRRKVLPSQKGRTAFSKFYAGIDTNAEGDTGLEKRNLSSVARTGHASLITNGRKSPKRLTNGQMRTEPPVRQQGDVDFYFEFNDEYYLPE